MTSENAAQMYQLEVKLQLAASFFRPGAGWKVNVHVDPMELARGGRHGPDKPERAAAAERALKDLGVRIGAHDRYGRVDLVADGPTGELHLIEVEGDSTRQKEQAVYSSLGQLVVAMKVWGPSIRYGIAVPGTPGWLRQLAKIPSEVRQRLSIDMYIASAGGGACRISPAEEVPRQART